MSWARYNLTVVVDRYLNLESRESKTFEFKAEMKLIELWIVLFGICVIVYTGKRVHKLVEGKPDGSKIKTGFLWINNSVNQSNLIIASEISILCQN